MTIPALPGLGVIDDERTARLRARESGGAGAREEFVDLIERYFEGAERDRVRAAYLFAGDLQYDHEGISSDAYFAHPLRVARLVMELPVPTTVETVVVALLHNVLEVGSISADELESRFGRPVREAIENLTIDRPRQWQREYKDAYYRTLHDGPAGTRTVKVLDKLDNIFQLCIHPDDMVRARYLAEIETYVIPLADMVCPALGDYMRALVENSRTVGYLGELGDGANAAQAQRSAGESTP